MKELQATFCRPALLSVERRAYHGAAPSESASEPLADENDVVDDDGGERTAIPSMPLLSKMRTPPSEGGRVVLAKAIKPQPDEALYAEVVASCMDTITMLARHRAERPLHELAANEEQLLAQVDAIAVVGGDCVELALHSWKEDLENPWRAWAATFTLACLGGVDTLDRLEDEIAELPKGAMELGERIGEALLIAPHPGIPALARNLLGRPHPIGRSIALDVLCGRGELADVGPYLREASAAVLAAAIRGGRALPKEEQRAALLPLLDHPSPHVASSAARQLSRAGALEPYFRVREGLPLAGVLGAHALELFVQFGDESDEDAFDEVLFAQASRWDGQPSSMSAPYLSAIARFGSAKGWEILLHHLQVPELAEAAARALVTLFGPLVSRRELGDRRAWQAAIAGARFNSALRYFRGEPWRPGAIVQECLGGAVSRVELELRLDELAARTGHRLELEIRAWAPDLLPGLRTALSPVSRLDGDWTPGSWHARGRQGQATQA